MWVLQFTVSASLVGALVLFLKWLFHDKLDARWHYLIWLVVLARMLVPLEWTVFGNTASLFRVFPVLRWLRLGELALRKNGGEGLLRALFYLYAAGAVSLLLYYGTVYLHLRRQLRRAWKGGPASINDPAGKGGSTWKSDPARKNDPTRRGGPAGKAGGRKPSFTRASERTIEAVRAVADKYHIKSCERVCVGAESGSFVCGFFRPVLVLSERMEQEPEEAVILHELLHLRYGDVPVNLMLRLIRALQWFNPLAWFLTDVVQNDSEALCDQRVLEYMAGREPEGSLSEEKIQRYGELLIALSAKEGAGRGAKVGTSDMANSRRSLRTRVVRIADFRKVPGGVGFVAAAITLVLTISCISYAKDNVLNVREIDSAKDLQLALWEARLYESTTSQQALYLYERALREGNPLWLMAVTPESGQDALEEWALDAYEKGILRPNCLPCFLPGEEAPYIGRITGSRIYSHAEDGNGNAHAILDLEYGNEGQTMRREITLREENGWRIASVADWNGPKEPALFTLSGEDAGFAVTVECWNEAYFDFGTSGWKPVSGGGGIRFFIEGTTAAEEGEAALPEEFSESYKCARAVLTYFGEEDLSGRLVKVAVTDIWGEGAPEITRSFSGDELMDGGGLLVFEEGHGPAAWEGLAAWEAGESAVCHVAVAVQDGPEVEITAIPEAEITAMPETEITAMREEGDE